VRTPFPRPTGRRRQESALAEQLARMVVEIHRTNLIRLHHIFVEQLDRAIDDPPLAMALSTLEGLSEEKRRQMLFADREYGALLLGYRVGAMDRSELLGTLKILSNCPAIDRGPSSAQRTCREFPSPSR
jgi:hypothetical protein